MVRYSFTVRDSHPLLLAGLPAHIGFVSQNPARGSGSWTPVSKVSVPKYETKPIQASMSDLPALQRLECKERLGKLPPERRLVAAEPVHDLAVEIRQVQKADRDVAR